MHTCQICGTSRKLYKDGKVFQHGYTQPRGRRGGWVGVRSGNCPGTNHVPFEVGHDALDEQIVWHSNYITERSDWLRVFRAVPPAELRWYKDDAISRRHQEKLVETVAERPENFDRTIPAWRYGEGKEYAARYHFLISDTESMLEKARRALKYLQDRRVTWVAPALDPEDDPANMFSRKNFNASLEEAGRRYREENGLA